jgi:hypothetical protein
MKILCNHCKHFFEVNPEKEGRVQYSKEKSIFRVELILKSPCPNCQSPLKVLSNEKQEHIGYAYKPTAGKKIPWAEKPKQTFTTPPTTQNPAKVSPTTETVYNPSLAKKSAPTKEIKKVFDPSKQQKNVEPRIAISNDFKVAKSSAQKTSKTSMQDKPMAKLPVDHNKSVTLEDRVKAKLQLRLDSHHRYSVQSFKKSQPRNRVIIPNLGKIAQHTSQPKVYLSILTIASMVLIFGIMKSVFQGNDQTSIAKNEPPKIEEAMEEFEPTHHDDSVGGPGFPSETNKKPGLDDEVIKKIASNLQILHLPPLRQVTSTYGIRLDPFTKKLAFHAGVDFKADTGTKIEAAMDGIVKYAGRKSMYGNAVVIKHENGYETLYGHLSKTMVKQGDKIKQKDIIGLAGSTGRSTGPHLHFELIKNGKKIDPLSTDLLDSKNKKKK